MSKFMLALFGNFRMRWIPSSFLYPNPSANLVAPMFIFIIIVSQRI